MSRPVPHRRWPTATAALVVAVLAAGCAASTVPATRGTPPTPAAPAAPVASTAAGSAPPEPAAVERTAAAGADGAGDPYFPLDGNGGYDVRRYRVEDTYRPGSGRLTGRTTLLATATRDLRSFSLDLVVDATSVRVDGERAAYRRPSVHELRVQHPLRAGERFEVVVHYAGRPASVRATGVQPFIDGYDEGYALGEPQIGAWWFAANETPEDRATFDIRVRVPRGFQAVSSVTFVDRSRAGRWTWWR